MGKSARKLKESLAQYYDRRGVLGELDVRPVEFALEEELRRQILGASGRAGSRTSPSSSTQLRSQALRKIATMKSIPYQTLIRQWLADGVRRELHLPEANPTSAVEQVNGAARRPRQS